MGSTKYFELLKLRGQTICYCYNEQIATSRHFHKLFIYVSELVFTEIINILTKGSLQFALTSFEQV